jgi:nitroreductase
VDIELLYEKIVARRTIRRFTRREISKELLLRCVDAARLSPSGGNRQPLKYIIVKESTRLKEVFNTLTWAAYLPKYSPSTEEMPRAYVIIVLDKNIREEPRHDAGIAAMSISLVAFGEGLGSCILGSVNRKALRHILNLPDHFKIVLVVALGYPAEKSVIEEMKEKDVKYRLDRTGVLHVPKRDLESIVVWNSYEE